LVASTTSDLKTERAYSGRSRLVRKKVRKLSKQTIHVAPKWTNEYPTWNSLAASLSPSSVRRSWQLATWDCMAAITKSTHAFSYAADAMAVKRKKTHDRSLVIQSTDVYATRRRTNLLTSAPSSPTSPVGSGYAQLNVANWMYHDTTAAHIAVGHSLLLFLPSGIRFQTSSEIKAVQKAHSGSR